MSYEKDKELMQKIHDLIDDYNYLNKVIPIVTETYLKERVNFYIEAYQDYKDILDYQLGLINDFFNINLENPINMEKVKEIINESIDLNFVYNPYHEFNQNFKDKIIELDKEIKKNIENTNKKEKINKI